MDSTSLLSYAQHIEDWDMHLKVERCLSVVGEAATRIRKLGFEAEIPQLHKVIGFRNIIVHNYDAISQPDVWGILRIHLPELVSRARYILDSSDEKGDQAFTL